MANDLPYENLVIEGGGVNGLAYCGALKELDKRYGLSKFKRVAGASVGSLFAALVVIGFTGKEIYAIKDALDFSILQPGCFVSVLYNVTYNYGIKEPESLNGQIREILSEKVNPDITLRDLYAQTGKDLVIVTCCVNRNLPVYLHHSQFPNVTLIDAITCSSAVPGLFQPMIRDYLGENDYYMDGGFVDNYPMWVFNDIEKLYSGELSSVSKECECGSTLGLKLLTNDEENTHEVYSGRKEINNVYNYFTEVFNSLSLQIERLPITESYIERTIPIKTGGIFFLDFDMTEAKKKFLIDNGTDAVRQYFKP